MITADQQEWLNHLSSDDKVDIRPYDPNSEILFNSVCEKVISVLGNCKVLHRGASYLKISGQNEIDVYVPVKPEEFRGTISKMISRFGEPKSLYPLVRARFSLNGYDKRVDVFVINEDDKGWIDSEIFTSHLLSHPKDLDKYKKLKESGRGLSTKEYYTRKIEFINDIIGKVALK